MRPGWKDGEKSKAERMECERKKKSKAGKKYLLKRRMKFLYRREP
jgi:hypothetical protein